MAKLNRHKTMLSPDEIDETLDKEFNPVKKEIEEEEDERPKIKTTPAFDNSRLEFLRMQIGPVQNFYQTLGNILYSLSMRVDVAEAKIENLNMRLLDIEYPKEEEQSETKTDKS